MHARFDLIRPRDLDNVLAACAQAGEPPMLLAGGTVALVDIRAGKIDPKAVLSLGEVSALRGVCREGKAIVMGACTTVSDILASADLAAAPSLIQASEVFAGLMVRNTATVAGNIACGSPAADLVPPLLSLDAEVELARAGGVSRRVPLASYYRGYKQDVRAPGELITKIILPDPDPGDFNAFYKLGRRKGDAITIVGVAVRVRMSGDRCGKVRIALGSVAPAAMRATGAEAVLEGHALSAAGIDEAAEAAARECSPIDDVRASGAYRRKMVRVLVRRLLNQAAEKLS